MHSEHATFVNFKHAGNIKCWQYICGCYEMCWQNAKQKWNRDINVCALCCLCIMLCPEVKCWRESVLCRCELCQYKSFKLITAICKNLVSAHHFYVCSFKFMWIISFIIFAYYVSDYNVKFTFCWPFTIMAL